MQQHQRILITGGNGGLGREVVARLRPDENIIRIMSRGTRPERLDSRFEWAQADIQAQTGLESAVKDVQVIVHLASQSFGATQAVDVEGTRRLLELGRQHGITNFVYIGIVGVEHFPNFTYYKAKAEAERLIETSGLSYTILRATQFHSLIDMALNAFNRLPIITIPTNLRVQPIDTGEVAAHLAALVTAPPAGRVPDIAGPDVLTTGEMAREWLRLRGIRKPLINLPIPGQTFNAFRRGMNTAPDRAAGKITWAEWVAKQYGASPSYETVKATR